MATIAYLLITTASKKGQTETRHLRDTKALQCSGMSNEFCDSCKIKGKGVQYNVGPGLGYRNTDILACK